MNPIDELELDVLAATGDVEMAEMAGLMAQAAVDDLIEIGCYMLGIPVEMTRWIWYVREQA